MTEITSLRPVVAVSISLLATVPILASRRRPNLRESWTMLAALGTFAVVASMVPGVLAGDEYVTDFGTFVPGVEFALRADALGVLFALLASTLWVVTSLYSVGYMRGLDESNQSRYFAAFAASVASAVGVAFAHNLIVLFVFYELLSVATYPLVAHDETEEARAAGRKYLAYTFGGGVAVLAGTLLVYLLTGTGAEPGTVDFVAGGIADLATADPVLARTAFALLVGGFGVKAALMPVHSWLPDAMVAPTPVSGLLHAVAVVKSGVFGIARVVLEVFGPGLVGDLGVGLPLAVVAAFTLVTASVIALRQDNLKRRLAFSTVSQLSYIVLGIALLGPLTIVGGLLHIPAHAFMKLTLFFCAGAVHVETHTDDISDMAGIGKRMPLTMTAFTVAAAGMAGIPLVAGFVSKLYMIVGASGTAGQWIFAFALVASGVLNVGYFWPVVSQAFFESEDRHDAKPLVEFPFGGRSESYWADGGRPAEAGRSARADRAVGDGDGEYAVDRNPSDADVPRPGDPDEHDEGHGDHGPGDHGHGHHGGPPPDGWERRTPLTESTGFMLFPIVFAVTGAVVLGVVPDHAVFLDLTELIVEQVLGTEVGL